MQSMNMGLREGADLAVRLTTILRDKGSTELLKTYDMERRIEWEQLLGLKGGPQASTLADEWIREHSAQIPACIPASGMELTLLLQQLGLEIERPLLDKVEVESAILV
jgi:hypothetical protein